LLRGQCIEQVVETGAREEAINALVRVARLRVDDLGGGSQLSAFAPSRGTKPAGTLSACSTCAGDSAAAAATSASEGSRSSSSVSACLTRASLRRRS
jgi:hypothetical protein